MTDEPVFMTTEEVAARYRTTRVAVRVWHRTGRGPKGFRAGKRTLYRLEDVLAWERQLEEAEAVRSEV